METFQQAAGRAVMGQGHQGASYNSPEHSAIIASSQERSRRFGLAALQTPDFSGTSEHAVRALLEENHFLLQHAGPVMQTLYEQITNTHSMVLLTTRTGTILRALGDADFLERASQVALAPGIDWSEQNKGTNAIGTALAEGEPIVVHGHQHFLQANQFLTCSCSPILDPHGTVIGALDVTGDYRSYHQHTMALARMSAQLIENHMFADVFRSDVRIHFHARPEFLGTMVEGIAVFTHDGRFLSVNRSAQFQLGMSLNALRAHTLSSLFGVGVSEFLDLARAASGHHFRLCLHDGVSVCCQSELKFSGPAVHTNAKPSAATTPRKADVKLPLSSLRYLDTGDPQLGAVIQKLQIVQGRDIPIMILGETGTGKDLLAQAIHNDSTRRNKNFVSLNCASIPESLIESELFGYEEGAFTGAKRKGATGKIAQAHGGTLFLDEIGDMPPHLQARLLRVLQERKVCPLGSSKEVEVDVAVICATNKNLKAMIAQGSFREDLYYRLNGLVVKLPALRDRKDLDVVTRKILASVCPAGTNMGIEPEVMDLFARYGWPGNFRQLFNLLRTAVVMAEGTPAVALAHLPDDFLADMACGSPQDTGLAPQPVALRATTAVADTSAALEDFPPPADLGADANPSLQNLAIEAIAQALRRSNGNISTAARLLGVSRNTIYRKKHLLPDELWR